MKKKMLRENGIKSITLIILTTILILTFVEIVINLTIREHKLVKKIDTTTQKYEQEEIRQIIETEITNTVEKEKELGNEITVKRLLQELVKAETFESIDKERCIGNIGEYEIKLKQDELGNIVIEDIREAAGIRITYKLDPKGYTNKENVAILFKVQGKVKSVTKPDGLVIYPKKDKIAIDYEVDKNGRYQFIVENEDGTSITKDVIIDTIDKLAPSDFEISLESKVPGKLSIKGVAKDLEEDETNVKSGIEKYEYFVKREGKTDYVKYESSEIALGSGKYKVYAIAYDKAGNSKKSQSEKEIKIVKEPLYLFNEGLVEGYTWKCYNSSYGVKTGILHNSIYAYGVWGSSSPDATWELENINLSEYSEIHMEVSTGNRDVGKACYIRMAYGFRDLKGFSGTTSLNVTQENLTRVQVDGILYNTEKKWGKLELYFNSWKTTTFVHKIWVD